MYNITLIDNNGNKYISVDNLEKANYSEINIVGDDFNTVVGNWVGDASPKNLQVIIDAATLNTLRQKQSLFDGRVIVLDDNKMTHLMYLAQGMDLHMIEGCQEDFGAMMSLLGGTAGYLNIKPKFIGLPLVDTLALVGQEQFDVNWNDNNDSFYFIDLSNLKSSCGNGGLQQFSYLLLLLLIFGGVPNSVGCPLFLDNKELTLSSMTFGDLGVVGDDFIVNASAISKKHFNNLNSLQDGAMMFMGCSKIKDFPYELPKLSQSAMMFSFSGIKEFKINMPSLKCATFNKMSLESESNGIILQIILKITHGMFSNSKLETFVSDMPELSLGDGMFAGCSNLTTFVGSLGNLKSGRNMFGRGIKFTAYEQLSDVLNAFFMCILGSAVMNGDDVINYIEEIPNSAPKLTPMSVINILDTLPDRGVPAPEIDFSDVEQYMTNLEGIITIGIGAYEETRDEFANEMGFDSFDELTAAFNNKGWTVEWIFQQVATYSLRRNTKKFYKLIEYTGEIKVPSSLVKSHNLPETIKVDDLSKNPKAKIFTDKLRPEYKSNTDSSKLYRLAISESDKFCKDWEEFESLEEALVHYDISPIEEK